MLQAIHHNYFNVQHWRRHLDNKFWREPFSTVRSWNPQQSLDARNQQHTEHYRVGAFFWTECLDFFTVGGRVHSCQQGAPLVCTWQFFCSWCINADCFDGFHDRVWQDALDRHHHWTIFVKLIRQLQKWPRCLWPCPIKLSRTCISGLRE